MEKLAIVAWRDVVASELSAFGTKLAAFLPNLVGALVILLAGWGVSWLLAQLARRGLRTLGIDRFGSQHHVAERVGLSQDLSDALATLAFWGVLLVFLLASVHTLGVTAVTATLDRLIAYIPNLIGAALTAVLGLLLARFVGSVTASAAVAAGITAAPRIGFLVQALGLALVGAITVEQLGLKIDILVLPVTALLVAAGLSVGLAFALGAQPIITHILAGHFLKQSLPRDRFVEVDGERGIVERVGPTDTLLKNGDRRWSVPNGQLLERIVLR
jgi:hypothetical protein